MATQKKSAASAAEQQLKAAVKKLQAQLKVAERSAEKWKARARARVSPTSRPVPVAAPPSAPSGPTSTAGPDDTWTVAALRAEARSRGLTNYSRKTKAELIDALRG